MLHIKKRYRILTLLFLFSLLMICYSNNVVFANAPEIIEWTEEMITIDATYRNGQRPDNEGTVFLYNDAMLFDWIGKQEPSGDLALASVGLADCAYSRWRIENALHKNHGMGFSIIYESEYYSEKKATYDDNDVVAFLIAEKYVRYKGEVYRIIIVPIRGTNGNCEWYSNFNLGTGDNHQGFYAAANEVLAKIEGCYISPSHDVDHTIVWTMGHSRGAAVANVVAGTLSTSSAWTSRIPPSHVFGYTFACPAVSRAADTSLKNIYNYNNGGDVVPVLPLRKWGFDRFGQTLVLPESDYDNLRQQFYRVMGNEYTVGMSAVYWEDILVDLAPSAIDLEENDVLSFAMEAAAYFLGGKSDPEHSLLDIALSHPCAVIKLGGKVKSLFSVETYKKLAAHLSADAFLRLLSTDLQDYFYLKDWLAQAIYETAFMSDTDSEDEATHDKYVAWRDWYSDNIETIRKITNYADVNIESKEDLRVAKEIVDRRFNGYDDLLSTVQKVWNIFFGAEGGLSDPLTQGHPATTYVLWINSWYYGYKGWYGNQSITTVNWKGRSLHNYIGPSCFEQCHNIQSIVVFESMTIGYDAFAACQSIASISIPDYVVIGDGAFNDCDGLLNVSLDGKDISIGSGAFGGCDNLEEIIIPDSIKRIKGWAFAYCSKLRKVSLPSGYEKYTGEYTGNLLGYEWVFWKIFENSPVEDFTIIKGESGEISIGDLGYFDDGIKRLTIGEGIISCGSRFFIGFTKLEELVLPSTLQELGFQAFFMNERPPLSKIIFEGSVADWCKIDFNDWYANPLQILDGEFYIGGELAQDLKITQDVEEISKYAFFGYQGLEKLTVSEGVSRIGKESFQYCSGLIEVNILGETEIDESAFADCTNLVNLNLSGAGIKIGRFAFGNCSRLEELIIPDSIQYVEGQPFDGCEKLSKVSMPFNSHLYYSWPFNSNSPISEITITKGISGNYYDENTFGGSLSYSQTSKRVIVSEGVTSLGYGMFNYCHVDELVLPSSLQRINSNAFQYAEIKEIVYGGDISSWCGIVFQNEESNPLHKGNTDLFIDGEKVETLVVPQGTEIIEAFAFYNYKSLQKLVTPKTLKSIGKRAFAQCGNLKELQIDGTTEVGEGAFSSCENLVKISFLGEGIVISYRSFSNCNKLAKVVIPDHIKEVSSESFGDCASLQLVSIPFHREVIYGVGNVFYNCPITEVTITKGKTGHYYGEETTFLGQSILNESIKRIIINDGVKSLSGGMLRDLERIEVLELPKTLETVGGDAFYKTSFAEIIYHGDVVSWCDIDFENLGATPLCMGEANLIIDGSLLTTLVLQEGMTRVKPYAFHNYTALRTVDIPQSLIQVGEAAFLGCAGLTDVYFSGTQQEWDSIIIEDYNTPLLKATLHCQEKPEEVIPPSVEELRGAAGIEDEGIHVVMVREKEEVLPTLAEIQQMASELQMDVANLEVISSFDINVFSIQYDEDGREIAETRKQINQLEKAVTLTFVTPGAAGKTYQVVRVHINAKGEVEVTLLPTTDNGDGTVSVESDRFSMYYLVETEENPYIPGDINGDGKVNIFDVIRLLKKVTGEDVKTFANTDVNNDGRVNIFDVIRLLKYVTGEQVKVH